MKEGILSIFWTDFLEFSTWLNEWSGAIQVTIIFFVSIILGILQYRKSKEAVKSSELQSRKPNFDVQTISYSGSTNKEEWTMFEIKIANLGKGYAKNVKVESVECSENQYFHSDNSVDESDYSIEVLQDLDFVRRRIDPQKKARRSSEINESELISFMIVVKGINYLENINVTITSEESHNVVAISPVALKMAQASKSTIFHERKLHALVNSIE